MDLRKLIQQNREQILRLAAKHGARNVRLFGSVVRGESDEKSDVDFLVEMEPGRSLLDRAGLIVDLEQLLGAKVDVANERALRKRIRARVLQEAVPV